MKILIKTWGLVLAMAWGISSAGLAQDDENKVVIPLSQPGKPGLLKASLLQGSIKVSGHKGKDVILSYKGRGNRNPARAEEREGLRRLPTNNMGLEAEEEGNTVTIKASAIHKAVDLEVKVPHDFSVKLKTISDGQVQVKDLDGEIDIDNLNGSIILENVSGSASVSTLNGNIQASFRKLSTTKPMAFSSLNGKIDVSLPASAKFNAKLKTNNGEVFTDFDLDMEKEGRQVEKVSGGAGQKIYLDRWIYGKINGGGPELLFKSFNGNIYIRKAR